MNSVLGMGRSRLSHCRVRRSDCRALKSDNMEGGEYIQYTCICKGGEAWKEVEGYIILAKGVLRHCRWERLEGWDGKMGCGKNGVIRGIGSYDILVVRTDGTDGTDEKDGTGERTERKEQM